MLFPAPQTTPPLGVAIAQPGFPHGPRSRDTDRSFPTPPAAAWQIVACLLLLWLGSQAAALGRTWTSRDGRYSIQANFVKLEGDIVTLQTADTQTRTVHLAQLCEADQDLAQELARTLVHSVAVEVVGVGLSPDDALIDAFAKAIIQVVGAEISAKTVIEADELVQDRVLVFSDGFVKDYRDLGCRQQAGLSYRKILAYVQRRDLRSDDVDTGDEGNARRLYAEAYTKVRRQRIGMLLLQEALESFNAAMLDAKLAELGKPEVLPDHLDRVRITCRLTVQVQSDWYNRTRLRIERVLTAIARSQGQVEALHRRFPPGHEKSREMALLLQQRYWGRGDQSAADFGEIYNLLSAKSIERPPDAAGANARELSSTLFFVYVPPEAGDGASTAMKSRWRWFEIDGQPPIPSRTVDVLVRYSDEGGRAVVEEQFPLGPGVPGLSVLDTNAKLRTVLVSPFFLSHAADGYEITDFPHSPQVTLTRKITVPLTTLARVNSAKAVVIDRPLERSASFAATTEVDESLGIPLVVEPASPVTEVQNAPIGAFTASTNDLANQNQPSLLGLSLEGGRLAGDSSLEMLNDGDLYGGREPQNSSFAFQCVAGVVVFQFNTADAPRGYDITKLVSITGSGGGNQQRSRQNYIVEVAGGAGPGIARSFGTGVTLGREER